MAKHTPGPWNHETSFPTSIWTASGVWVGSANTEAIEDFEQRVANARLMAAAPELLDALNKAIAYLANPQAFDAEGLGQDWFALKAKAEGR